MNTVSNAVKLFSAQILKKRNVQNQTQVLNHSFYFNNVRHLQTSSKNDNPRTPDLIYIPHLLRWLKTKFKFKYLQKTWDPEFSEGAFIYGTTRAVCKVTDIIHNNTPEELEGLLAEAARLKLTDNMKTKITKVQKRIIKLRPEDIKILVPLTVNFKNKNGSKTCEVTLRSLALKWYKDNGALRLVLIALQTEFSRNYTYNVDAGWIITVFDILECAMLTESASTR